MMQRRARKNSLVVYKNVPAAHGVEPFPHARGSQSASNKRSRVKITSVCSCSPARTYRSAPHLTTLIHANIMQNLTVSPSYRYVTVDGPLVWIVRLNQLWLIGVSLLRVDLSLLTEFYLHLFSVSAKFQNWFSILTNEERERDRQTDRQTDRHRERGREGEGGERWVMAVIYGHQLFVDDESK